MFARLVALVRGGWRSRGARATVLPNGLTFLPCPNCRAIVPAAISQGHALLMCSACDIVMVTEVNPTTAATEPPAVAEARRIIEHERFG